MLFGATALIMVDMVIGYDYNMHLVTWNIIEYIENGAKSLLTRWTLPLASFMIIFVMFHGSLNVLKVILTRPVFIVIGKMCFITSLITPFCIQFIYSFCNGMYMQWNVILMFAAGNVLFSVLVAIVIYLTIEFPIKKLLDWSLMPYISSDKMLHEDF